jgi:hypothetical protein
MAKNIDLARDKRQTFFANKLQIVPHLNCYTVTSLETHQKYTFSDEWDIFYLARELGWVPQGCPKCSELPGFKPCECGQMVSDFRTQAKKFLKGDTLWDDPGTLLPPPLKQSWWHRLWN